jgi:hypothetical protein
MTNSLRNFSHMQTVSREDAESANAVVCTYETIPLILPDNLTGPCADCGDMLQWRPESPAKPEKICYRCASIRYYGSMGRVN